MGQAAFCGLENRTALTATSGFGLTQSIWKTLTTGKSFVVPVRATRPLRRQGPSRW